MLWTNCYFSCGTIFSHHFKLIEAYATCHCCVPPIVVRSNFYNIVKKNQPKVRGFGFIVYIDYK